MCSVLRACTISLQSQMVSKEELGGYMGLTSSLTVRTS